MKRKNKPVLRVLALIMALVCLGVSLAPASFAFAGVLDPAAWLYPIWSMYGAQNGVNVTTTGDADFTIDGMTSLWNEYQASRVSSGVQQAAQTITDFVNGVKGFVSVVAGAVTGGSLNTKLMLGAGIVGALDAFWNWIITDKLGGTSVDSTDFDQDSGNLVLGEGQFDGQPVPYLVMDSSNYTQGVRACPATFGGDVYFSSYQTGKIVYVICLSNANSSSSFTFVSPSSNNFLIYAGMPWIGGSVSVNSYNYQISYNSTYNLFYAQNAWGIGNSSGTLYVPYFDTLEQGLAAVANVIENGDLSGSLTVAPDAGVDVLGFPDSDELNYVPSDAVIPWNIPYDSTKDTDAYIDAAFADAVSGDLTIGEEGEVIQPVPGVGPVGDYVAVGLGDVFPFCIPFDIYDFLSALAADPVAPSFTAELAFPEAVGGLQYVELDFDTPTFNQLASILRTMELLAFIVGLALLTRSMFIRG